MELPSDILEQLAFLCEDPARFEHIAKSEGVKFLRRLMGKAVAAAELFNRWYPELQRFAASKRADSPELDVRSLTDIEQAWTRILAPKVRDAEHVPTHGRHTAVIFVAPLCSFQLFKRHWPSTVPNAVFLTPEESAEWHTIYEHPEAEFWWFAFQWWDVQTEIPEDSLWFTDGPPALPGGLIPWLVHWGLQWGELMGGEHAELWAWDGTSERRIEDVGTCDF